MQFYYTTITTLVILFLNLSMAVEGGYLDISMVALAILQGLIIGIYIVLFIKSRKDK